MASMKSARKVFEAVAGKKHLARRAIRLAALSLLLLAAATVPGCGLAGQGRLEALSRVEDRHNRSLHELSTVTPGDDPRKIGIEILKGETAQVAAELPPVPATEKLPAVPFVAAAAAAAQAEAEALKAGAPPALAKKAGAVAAAQKYTGSAAAGAAGVASLQAASAESGGSETVSWLSGILSGFGPWGAAAGGILSLGFGLFERFRRRKLWTKTKTLITGFEDAKDAVLDAVKTDGAAGLLTSDKVKEAMNGAMQAAQEVLPDYVDFAKQIVQAKAEYRAG
jgi:hypothetical protein